MSSQPSKTTPSKGFTCDCEDPDNLNTTYHKSSCWKVPKCETCKRRIDDTFECRCEDSDDTYGYNNPYSSYYQILTDDPYDD